MLFLLSTSICVVHAQVSVTSGGVGQTNADPNNAANGDAASGLGCGGGGANFYGGNGGNGKYGGGGGGAAGFSAINMIGGAGGQGVVVVAFYNGATFLYTTVYQNGTSLTIPGSVDQVKVWALGAGGGGAGSTGNDGTAGGGGGAGGTSYITRSVAPGDVITYTLGNPGAGGVDTNNGSAGGNSTATINSITITGFGGAGGLYNNNLDAIGGAFSGGDGGGVGGSGKGASSDINGGGGGGIGGTIGGTSTSGSGGDGANAADVSGLFSALSGASLLPLGWKSFTVSNQNKRVRLQWETSYEVNTLNFTAQYGTNGRQFKNIGVVSASNNANGSQYNFIHQNALPGLGYYRLYQTDINGKFSYSKIIKNIVPTINDKEFILYSNAITDGNIKMEASKRLTISLVSFDGKVLSVHTLNKGINNIQVGNLAKGYYALKSLHESQKVMVQ